MELIGLFKNVYNIVNINKIRLIINNEIFGQFRNNK